MIVDVPFDEAKDTFTITLRLHPIDVGFDLRAEKVRVGVPPSAELRASYADADGERRVVSGSWTEVVAWLRRAGYRIVRA